MKTCVLTVIILAFFVSIIPAAAQGSWVTQCPLPTYPSSCTPFWFPNFGPPPDPPVGMACCNPGGIPWSNSCIAPRLGCLIPNTANEICLTCMTGKVGQPIDLATGNTYIIEQDVSIPGLGGGLQLTRTWNSLFPAVQNTYPTMFGNNWRSNYEERLIFNSPDFFLKYARGDGSVWSFSAVSLGPNTYKVAAPANDTTTTIVTGSPNLTMTSKTGEKRLFALSTGALVAIIDRNGNTTQLSYDAQNRLATVTDPASRHLYFNYTGNSTLVASVTSDAGITYSYTYDGQARLTKVTKPDNATVTFVYDSNNMITTVKDSAGKVLESHTYDALGRGLTSSRANGVDGVTVTYPH